MYIIAKLLHAGPLHQRNKDQSRNRCLSSYLAALSQRYRWSAQNARLLKLLLIFIYVYMNILNIYIYIYMYIYNIYYIFKSNKTFKSKIFTESKTKHAWNKRRYRRFQKKTGAKIREFFGDENDSNKN